MTFVPTSFDDQSLDSFPRSKLHTQLKRLSLRSTFSSTSFTSTDELVNRDDQNWDWSILRNLSQLSVPLPPIPYSRLSTESLDCPIDSLTGSTSPHGSYPNAPRTSNNLDPKERKKLLKSARKISRILGEQPIVLGDQTHKANNLRRTTSLTVKKPARPDAVPDETERMSPSSRSRPKSFISPQVPERAVLSFQPIYPVSMPNSPRVDKASFEPDCPRALRSRRSSSVISFSAGVPPSSSPSDSVSTIISISNPEDTPEKRRARMAKLSHHLGENIPAELIFPRKSCATEEVKLVKVPTSNAGRLQKRVAGQRKSESCAPSQRPSGGGGVGLKRSNTARNNTQQGTEVPTKFDDPVDESLNQKRRSRNVKRASKMAQVFGAQPPPALFQITDTEPTSVPLDPDLDLNGRLSLEIDPTKVPTTTFACIHNRRASGSSVDSELTSDSCGTVEKFDFARCMSPGPDLAYAPESLVAPRRGSAPTFKISESVYSLLPEKAKGLVSASETDLTTAGIDSEVLDRPSSPGFGTRRRRVAKLSKFFGVGYNDVVDTLADPPEVPPLAPVCLMEEKHVEEYLDVTKQTQVRWQARTGLWFRGPEKPNDIRDVIGKLREL